MNSTTLQQANEEELLQRLAQEESEALARLEEEVKKHDESMRKVEAKFIDRIGPLIEAEATTRAALHNAIVDMPYELWTKRKTRVVGKCKFGWRKKRGRIVIDNEEQAMAKLETIIGPAAATACIQVKRTLIKKRLNDLAADVLRKCGISVERDAEEVVVVSTTSELAKRVEKLRDNSVTDAAETG